MDSTPITIAVDAMGGDFGPTVTVPAVLSLLARYPHIHFLLVGDKARIEHTLSQHKTKLSAQLSLLHAPETVEMHEDPRSAVRNKKHSSMRYAINAVKDNTAQACVSAGNTGALMATARFVLKTISGIDRPAIISTFPTLKGVSRVVDLGANVDCLPEHLLQFAIMATIVVKALDGIEKPRVALLNIGEEEIKGNEQIKATTPLFAQSPYLNFIGFAEGDDIYSGKADIIVCDGFVGNIALKTSEGVAKMVAHFIRQAFLQNIFTKMIALLAKPVLKRVAHHVDPRRYNGASLVGLKGIVIKSHGGTDQLGFATAVEQAILQVKQDIPSRIKTYMEAHISLGERESEGNLL